MSKSDNIKSNEINDNLKSKDENVFKDTNEVTNVKTSFYQKVDKFGDLFFLNIIFVLSCIPIFTIGAAITAMYAYLFKMVDDVEEPLWQGYWKYFKSNFKPATKVWIVLLIILGLMYGEYAYSLSLDDSKAFMVTSIIALEAIILSFILPLLFPLVARYENTTFNYFKNSLIILVSNLRSWFYLFFIWFIPILIYATTTKIFIYSWYLWLLIYISLFAYASSFKIKKLFRKIEEPHN